MRRLALVCLASLLASTPALAASPDPVKTKTSTRSQFYIFDGTSFEGRSRTPGIELMSPHRAARFDRLMSLKKDLVTNIFKTRGDRALR